MKKDKDHIEKAEDKIWRQWFDKLSTKDHKQYLQKLGLTEEDTKELPEVEEQLHSIQGEPLQHEGAPLFEKTEMQEIEEKPVKETRSFGKKIQKKKGRTGKKKTKKLPLKKGRRKR